MENKNTFKKVKEHGYRIIRNGHDTFAEDICRLLDRLDYLEKERLTPSPVQDKPKCPHFSATINSCKGKVPTHCLGNKDKCEEF
jgi:hypothetical protein